MCATGEELTILDVGPRLVSEVVGALECDGMAADALKLAMGDDVFDLVVSSECIEHTLDPELAIGEMWPGVQAGGHRLPDYTQQAVVPVMRASQQLGVRKY